MKAFKGWLTAKDPTTKTEVPFFVRTRSQDIEILNPVNIEEKLIKTSNIYTLTQKRDFIDYSLYVFTANSKNVYGVTMQKAYIEYRLYHDGSCIVNGTVYMPKTTSKSLTAQEKAFVNDVDMSNISSIVRFPLPYGFQWNNQIEGFSTSIFSNFIDVKCGQGKASNLAIPTLRSPSCFVWIPTTIDDADLAIRHSSTSQFVHEIIANPQSEPTGNGIYFTQFKIDTRYTTDVNEN